MYKNFNRFFFLFLVISYLSGCSSAIVGGATSLGLASVQERSIKDAAIDLKLELQIQEKLFRANTDKLFVNVDVVLLEQRVMLIGNVQSQELRDLASKIAWEVSPKIKNVLNEITVGEKPTLVSQAKDARISLSLSGLLIGDPKVSDINFTHSVSKQVIFLIGIAKDDEELNKVINHARTVKGVKKVISHLMLINDEKRM
jgi:osmotically-inducible protein OsmY